MFCNASDFTRHKKTAQMCGLNKTLLLINLRNLRIPEHHHSGYYQSQLQLLMDL